MDPIQQLTSGLDTVILIFYGLLGIIWQRKYHRGGGFWGLILCGVGTIFLLKNLEVTSMSIGEMFQYMGPVALILFGLHVIFKPRNKGGHKDWRAYHDANHEAREARRAARREHREQQRDKYKQQWAEFKEHKDVHFDYEKQQDQVKRELSEEEKAVLKDIHGEFHLGKHHEAWEIPDQASHREPNKREKKEHRYDDFIRNYDSGDVLHRHGFIGDVHLGQEPWELKPIQISHFIGDSVVDLTRATIPLGETPILVTAFIGDVKILIPNDIDVEVRVNASSFIGDMKVLDRRESGFLRSLRMQGNGYEEADRKLIVTTSMFIGDITIKKIG